MHGGKNDVQPIMSVGHEQKIGPQARYTGRIKAAPQLRTTFTTYSPKMNATRGQAMAQYHRIWRNT